MKKLISLALVLVTLLALTVPAFAEESVTIYYDDQYLNWRGKGTLYYRYTYDDKVEMTHVEGTIYKAVFPIANAGAGVWVKDADGDEHNTGFYSGIPEGKNLMIWSADEGWYDDYGNCWCYDVTTISWSNYTEPSDGEDDVTSRVLYFKPLAEYEDAEISAYVKTTEGPIIQLEMELIEDGIFRATLEAGDVLQYFRLWYASPYLDLRVDSFIGEGNLCTMADEYYKTEGYKGYYYEGTWSTYAAEGEDAPSLTQPTNNTADVTATIALGEEAAVVYSVGITWGAMDFVYNEGSKGTWDPDTFTYVDAEEGGWSWETANGNNAITVSNASNAAVRAKLSFEAADELELTGAFMTDAAQGSGSQISDNALLLNSAAPAEGEEEGSEQTAYAYFHILDGELTEEIIGETETIKLGTITVTFEAVTPAVVKIDLDTTRWVSGGEDFYCYLEADSDAMCADNGIEFKLVDQDGEVEDRFFSVTNYTVSSDGEIRITLSGLRSQSGVYSLYYKDRSMTDWVMANEDIYVW